MVGIKKNRNSVMKEDDKENLDSLKSLTLFRNYLNKLL